MSRLSPLRPFFLLAPLGLLYLLIGGRLIQLHTAEVVLAETYAERLEGESTLLADRGMITDRAGVPLAYDRPSYQLEYGYKWEHRRYNPATWKEPMTEEQIREEIARVADVCELDAEVLEADLRDQSLALKPFAWGVDPFHADRIRGVLREYPGFGIVLRETRTREYPLGRAASHMIGLYGQFWKDQQVGVDEDGMPIREPQLSDAATGVELAFNDRLKGTPGVKQSERIKHGINPATAMIEPRSGATIETTLDAHLQECTVLELQRAVEELNPDNVSSIVLDPKTGEILAAHSLPDYVPAKPDEVEPGRGVDGLPTSMHFKLSDPLVPGSTFKTFVVALALDSGAIGPQQTFPDIGHIYVKGRGRPISNASKIPPGDKTARECIIHSSNVVAVQIMQAIGRDRWKAFVERSHLWTPLQLPGLKLNFSQPPLDWKWKPAYAQSFLMPTMSFGQEFFVNPVRYAGLLAAFANGGVPVEPHLIKGQGKPMQRLFSEQATAYVAESMREMMDRQVHRNKTLPDIGVVAASKSGTARNPSDHSKNTVLFVTFAPVDDPQVLVLTVVHNPRVDPRRYPNGPSGTKHAGPVATRILQHALRSKGIVETIDPRSLESTEPIANLIPTPQPR